MPLISNNVKISLFHSDILEQGDAVRSSSVAVQHYDYSLRRQVNAYGEAYGDTSGCILQAVVPVGSKNDTKRYYEDLTRPYPSSYSFVMNALYDESGHLSEYDGAVVCEGYVVDVEESFSRSPAPGQPEQMSLRFKLLISNMVFVGVGKNLTYRFSEWQ